MPSSDSNSDPNSNPYPSEHNSPRASPSPMRYGDNLATAGYDTTDAQMQPQTRGPPLSMTGSRDGFSFADGSGAARSNGASHPTTPPYVYIVTSNFVTQTAPDGARLSESDIVGFQILAVFARVEDANSYAEHECEEIDAGVRRRRRNRRRGEAFGVQEGEGIRANAAVRDDGTISWSVEDAGQIEVGRWIVQ